MCPKNASVEYNDPSMLEAHLTPGPWRRIVAWTAVLAITAALAAALLWWLWPGRPAERAHRLLAENPALDLPGPPAAVAVIAQPGRWARLLARHPARRLLLDPAWWRGLESEGSAASGALAPAAAAVALLDQVRSGLVVASFSGGWIVQGRIRGAAIQGFDAWLPADYRGRTAIHGNVLRLASAASFLRGWGWRPQDFGVDDNASLACWLRVGGATWAGRWRGAALEVTHGRPPASCTPAAGAAFFGAAPDAAALLPALGVRLPHNGLLGGVARSLEGVLARPVELRLDELAPGQPLPRPRFVIELGWTAGEADAEARAAFVDRLRGVVCPFGCRVARRELDDGTPVLRWRSSVVTWWVATGPAGVSLATDRDRLASWLPRPAVVKGEPGRRWSADGARAAAALEVLSRVGWLADLGIVSRSRLRMAARLAGPLRGFSRLGWCSAPGGDRMELVFMDGARRQE